MNQKESHTSQVDPPEGARDVVERELKKTGDGRQDRKRPERRQNEDRPERSGAKR